MSQCIMAFKRKRAWTSGSDKVDVLTSHIVGFCLAGMAAVRAAIRQRNGGAAPKQAGA
jgi:dienelactone hydrolase